MIIHKMIKHRKKMKRILIRLNVKNIYKIKKKTLKIIIIVVV